MELVKKTTKVTSREDIYEAATDNFVIDVTSRISNETQLTSVDGRATKKTAVEGVPVQTTTFNKWVSNQLNVQFAPDLTEDEQIELLRDFNEITSTLNV